MELVCDTLCLHSRCHISQSSHSSGKYRRHTEPSLPFSISVCDKLPNSTYFPPEIFLWCILFSPVTASLSLFQALGISHLAFCNNSLSTSHLVPKTCSEEQPVCLCIVTMFLLFIKHFRHVPSGLEKVPTR